MQLSLDQILGFFVEFERSILQLAPSGLLDRPPRKVEDLLGLFENYSGCKFELVYVDFSDPSELVEGDHLDLVRVASGHVASFTLNFGRHAKIVLNSQKRPSGLPVLNYCYTRFAALKEAYHVIIRDEFLRWQLPHPDGNRPELLTTSIEEMLLAPFSIFDFGNQAYTETHTIENAAELLAILTLYPFDALITDREHFVSLTGKRKISSPTVLVASTLALAEAYKVPRRYVDILFRLDGLTDMYSRYEALRDRTGTPSWPPLSEGIKPPPKP